MTPLVSLPTIGSPLLVALPFAAALAGPFLGYFAARRTAVALLEKTLLDASRSWVADSQARHALDSARISELEGQIVLQRGVIDQVLQREASLKRFIWRSGLTVPGEKG